MGGPQGGFSLAGITSIRVPRGLADVFLWGFEADICIMCVFLKVTICWQRYDSIWINLSRRIALARSLG